MMSIKEGREIVRECVFSDKQQEFVNPSELFMFLFFLSYIRCPFVLLYSVLSLLFWGTIAVIGSLFIKRKNFGTLSQVGWCKGILWVAGLTVKVEGEENIPKDSALFLFNHTSLLDIPVMVSALPVDLRFVAKKELFQIPFFGQAMESVGTLSIDRSDHTQSRGIYHRVAEKIRNGLYIALAPEGTRQDEDRVGEFKSGPFVLAIEAQLPIVPVVIKGASEALPKKSFQINCGQWRREIRLKILPVTKVTGYSFSSRKELKEKVRGEMIRAFDELQASPK